MICNKCGSNVPDGRKNCINCGAEVVKRLDYMNDAPSGTVSREYKSHKEGKFLESKTGILLMGSGEILIGLFAALVAFIEIAPLDPGIGLMVALGLAIWCAGLPLLGVILIGTGVHKGGGIALIAGSVLCIPIGMVGIIAGKNAMNLDK